MGPYFQNALFQKPLHSRSWLQPVSLINQNVFHPFIPLTSYAVLKGKYVTVPFVVREAKKEVSSRSNPPLTATHLRWQPLGYPLRELSPKVPCSIRQTINTNFQCRQAAQRKPGSEKKTLPI